MDMSNTKDKKSAEEMYNRFIYFEASKMKETAGLGFSEKERMKALSGFIDNEQEREIARFIVTVLLKDETENELLTAFGSNKFIFEDNSNDAIEL